MRKDLGLLPKYLQKPWCFWCLYEHWWRNSCKRLEALLCTWPSLRSRPSLHWMSPGQNSAISKKVAWLSDKQKSIYSTCIRNGPLFPFSCYKFDSVGCQSLFFWSWQIYWLWLPKHRHGDLPRAGRCWWPRLGTSTLCPSVPLPVVVSLFPDGSTGLNRAQQLSRISRLLKNLAIGTTRVSYFVLW